MKQTMLCLVLSCLLLLAGCAPALPAAPESGDSGSTPAPVQPAEPSSPAAPEDAAEPAEPAAPETPDTPAQPTPGAPQTPETDAPAAEEPLPPAAETPDTPDAPDAKPPQQTPAFSRTLFVPSPNAGPLTPLEVTLSDDTDAALVDALRAQGVLAEDVQLLDSGTDMISDAPTVLLDFNEAFAAQIRRLGSSGEWLTVGAVVNTFLAAHPAQTQVFLTIEGAVLESGHAIYDYPLQWYGDDRPPEVSTYSLNVPDGDTVQSLPADQIFMPHNISMLYPVELFTLTSCTEDGFTLQSDALAPNGTPMASMALHFLDLSVESLSNQLSAQLEGDISLHDTSLAACGVPAIQISDESPQGYHLEFYLFEVAGTTGMLELNCDDSAAAQYIPVLVSMLNTLSIDE